MAFSAGFGVAAFSVSGLDMPLLWDDRVKGATLSVCGMLTEVAFLRGIDSVVALPWHSDFDRPVDDTFLEGISGDDITAGVFSFVGLSK